MIASLSIVLVNPLVDFLRIEPMTQMPPPAATVPAKSNVYTVLALVSVLMLLAGIGYVAYKNMNMTGSANPFALVEE